MKATATEFRLRFWIFVAIYWLSFSLYLFDHQNLGGWLAMNAGRLLPSLTGGVAVKIVFWLGTLLAVLGAALRTWATGYLRPEVMVDERVHSARLVADGPYRFLRNPLYFGNMLMAFGYAVMASRVGAPVLVALHVIFLLRLIGREEAALAKTQGESYAGYCRAVPRLWPSLTPRVPAAGHPFSLGGGILGEAFFWCLALAEAVFAVTLKIKVFYWVLWASFAVYAVCYAVIKLQRRSGDADRAL